MSDSKDKDLPQTYSYNDGIEPDRVNSLDYIVEKSGNTDEVTYQEASGAPVESKNPLGYNVSSYTVIFLNISMMVGTGIFSTPAGILNSTGSIGLALIYWVLGFILSAAGLAVYLEFASYFPARSGGEVVYLEQAWPRPKWFFPTTFAIQAVLLSFSSSNAIVMAQYIFRIVGRSPTPWELKGLAASCYTAAVIPVVLNNKYSLWFSNGIGFVKILTLTFITITGWVVLGGRTSVADPGANFVNSFEGTTTNGYNLANALVRITFSYAGYQNAFNVAGEIKNPVKTIKRNATISLTAVFVLYFFCNIAYFAAVPKAQLKNTSVVAASQFFAAVFGTQASRPLNVLVALSAYGNLLSVLIGQSRVIREIGRQGVLPFTKFWVTTWPFGTPVGPYLLKWGMTLLMILAPPAGDAFNFVVDLANYPDSFFLVLMASGIYMVRRQRKAANIGPSSTSFRAWDAVVVLFIASKVFLLVMPWFPPPGGIYGGSVSFLWCTSSITGIAIIASCAIYYWLWIIQIPKWKGFRYRQAVLSFDDGAVSHSLIKVPVEKLDEWGSQHDAAGRSVQWSEVGSVPRL